MKITEKNLDKIPKEEQKLVKALLEDIREINYNTPSFNNIYLDWIDIHTEYSPERVDPCPDYYGMYRIRRSLNNDVIGVEMTLEDLDTALCLLHNYLIYD
jgi:hypothetical protein